MAYIYVETTTVNSIDDVIFNINYTQMNSDQETKFLSENINFLKLEVDKIYENRFIDVGVYTNVHPSLFSYDGTTLTFQSSLIDYYNVDIVGSVDRQNMGLRAAILIGYDKMGIITTDEKTELNSLVSELGGSYTIETT